MNRRTPAAAPSPPPRTAELLLREAAGALDRIARGVSQLDAELASGAAAPERRRMLRHLLFTFFRRRKYLDARLAELLRRPTAPRLRRLLEAAATQILFQRGAAPESVVNVAVELAKREHAAGFVNAVLRRIAAHPAAELPETPESLFPDAVLDRWRARFDAGTLAGFAECWLAEPEFTFRLCAGEGEPEFPSTEVSGFGKCRFFRAEAAAVLGSEAMKRGGFYIQDPAASLAPSLVPEPEKIASALDLCAAPGGKALILAETLSAPGVRLVAADPSEKRQRLTRENFALRRRPAEIVVGEPASLSGAFELVLADVPCTNTGVFRHRPDALWRFDAETLRRTVARQREILREAARLTAPGGALIYSTCSIEAEENGELLAEFVGENPGFAIEESRLLLPDREHDGAFAARLRRR